MQVSEAIFLSSLVAVVAWSCGQRETESSPHSSDSATASIFLKDETGGRLALSSRYPSAEVHLVFLIGEKFNCVSCIAHLRQLCSFSAELPEEKIVLAVVGDQTVVSEPHFWSWVEAQELCLPAYFDDSTAFRKNYQLPQSKMTMIGLRRNKLSFAIPMDDIFWNRLPYPEELLRLLVIDSLHN